MIINIHNSSISLTVKFIIYVGFNKKCPQQDQIFEHLLSNGNAVRGDSGSASLHEIACL